MPNSIACTQYYTTIIDEVYQRASVSRVLNSGRRMVRAGRNAKEIMIPKIAVSNLGDYVRNEGYKMGSINYEFETKTFNYDRGIRLMADVMDVEEAGVLDCFVEAGSGLQRTQVASPADAYEHATEVTTDAADVANAAAVPANTARPRSSAGRHGSRHPGARMGHGIQDPRPASG